MCFEMGEKKVLQEIPIMLEERKSLEKRKNRKKTPDGPGLLKSNKSFPCAFKILQISYIASRS